jgi:uncharacterized RDD family membrane protein YckC
VFDLDASQLADQAPAQAVISGFWRRLLAFILDSLLLGSVGFALGLFWFDPLARLGGWGRLLGFCVSLVYFGLLNSAIGGGQTLGKRAMKIQVVDRSGHPISPGRSFLRYTVLGAPYFLNHLLVPPGAMMSLIGLVIGFILFGLGGAIVYLSIFNRRTRQSLHDLVAGTFVTRTTPPGQVVGSIRRPHLMVVGVWFMAVIGSCVAMADLSRQGVFPGLLKVSRSIQATGKVHMAEVYVGKTWRIGDSNRKETSYFQTTAICKVPPFDREDVAQEVASIVLRDYPEAQDMDVIAVTIAYGYDIGLASAWKRQLIRRSPSEWQDIVAKTSQK